MAEAIVFDLDDTLFPEREYVESGLRVVGAWLAEKFGIAAATSELLAEFARGERKGAFDRQLRRHGLSPALLPGLVTLYREHSPRIALRPGFSQLVGELRRTRAVGVLTDGPLVSQRRKIDALGLAPLVDAIWINDELGPAHWKPSPSGFERMEGLLAAIHDRIPDGYCYVGDNPGKDFVAARRRKWFTIEFRATDRLDPRPEPPEPEFAAAAEVATVDALAVLLRSRP